MRIRDLRLAHGLSVKELIERIGAAGVGVHEDSIRNVELGHKRASAPLMNAWARALGVKTLDVWQPEPDSGESVVLDHVDIEEYARSRPRTA